MQSIPPEFAPFNYYLEAAQQFQSRYPGISDVLNKCFSDSCQDLIDEGSASPEAQEFLNQFNENHTNPPDEAIQQTKQIADKFYQVLKKQYDAGKFSVTMEKQLGLTSILYSVLEGEDEKCEQCKEMRKSVQSILNGGIASTPTSSSPALGAYGSGGGPPAFTPQAPSPTIQNTTGPIEQPPAYPAIPGSSGSTGGPPVFTPSTPSPMNQNAQGSAGGPPVFTPAGFGSSQQPHGPPSFSPVTSTNSYLPPPSFNQSATNATQQQQFNQNSINIPSPAANSPPPYGSFPPTASMQQSQQNIQQPQQQQNFDASGAISFLNSLGYTTISSSIYPPLSNSTYPVIQTYLDYAISSLKNNDCAQSLTFLQNAFKIWTTGSQ